MPLIITPGYLTQRSEFYHQLGSMTSAGLGLMPALDMLRKSPPGRSYREPLNQVYDEIARGSTFAEALRARGQWMPYFDIALMEAGEQSGRLDSCLMLLSSYYKERASLVKQVYSDLTYPAFIVLFALVVFPTSRLVALVWQGDVGGFVVSKLQALVPLLVLAGFYFFFAQGSRSEFWRSCIETLIGRIPILGKARRHLALARFCASLEALVTAGVSVVHAWDLSGEASGSPMIRQEVARVKSLVLAGESPGEAIELSTVFPDLFRSLYRTGEASGRIDDTLMRLHRHYQEDAFLKLKALGQWVPRFIYIAILLVVAQQIVAFYIGYFEGALRAVQ